MRNWLQEGFFILFFNINIYIYIISFYCVSSFRILEIVMDAIIQTYLIYLTLYITIIMVFIF